MSSIRPINDADADASWVFTKRSDTPFNRAS